MRNFDGAPGIEDVAGFLPVFVILPHEQADDSLEEYLCEVGFTVTGFCPEEYPVAVNVDYDFNKMVATIKSN
jgi:hypothetical protein